MPELLLELPLTLRAHRARVCAQPGVDGGWAVRTEVDGREVASDFCGDWHRVERYQARMQRWLEAAERTEVERAATLM
jgi:hypothetical protein